MQRVYSLRYGLSRNRSTLKFVFAASVIFAFALPGVGQAPQLSLADLLVGLRSKKVPLTDRNKILADAVRQRGITFVLTEEIEKELSTTGADRDLLSAIRQKMPVPKAAEKTVSPVPVPVATPTPPDFNFYKARAESHAAKGDFAAALADFTKSLELKFDNPSVYFSRGQTFFSMKSYELSVTDFDKAIELNPKDSMAHFHRGTAHDRLGNTGKAMADFAKAVDLDEKNESAKASLKRLKDEQDARQMATTQVPTPAPEPPKPPEILNVGALGPANALKMVTPTYSTIAQRAGIEGRVTVDVELDADGNVVKAEATAGHHLLRDAAEDAARRSRFKPALFDGKPIKATGVITYNFTLKPTR